MGARLGCWPLKRVALRAIDFALGRGLLFMISCCIWLRLLLNEDSIGDYCPLPVPSIVCPCVL